jgi:hypothetical protein
MLKKPWVTKSWWLLGRGDETQDVTDAERDGSIDKKTIASDGDKVIEVNR